MAFGGPMEESKLGDGKTARSLSRRGCDQGKLSSRRERSRADQPRQLEVRFRLYATRTCATRATRSLLRLPHKRRPLPEMAGISKGTAAEDSDLLGSGRCLLYARRRRSLPEGPPSRPNTSSSSRPFRRRRLVGGNRHWHP